MICPICLGYMLDHKALSNYKKCPSCAYTCTKDTMKTKIDKLLSCNKCGRVHFVVSKDYARSAVEEFNRYYDTLPEYIQNKYYNGEPVTMQSYETCVKCGNSYKDFTEVSPGVNIGVYTVSPIVDKEEA